MKPPIKLLIAAAALAGPILACSTSPATAVTGDKTTAAQDIGLTGTLVVVNQQSDTVTLIDLAKMAAYRHV